MTLPAKTKNNTKDLVYMAVFTALMAICSWISIPTAVPFTLQTFAVFLTVSLLGGKKGACVVLVYILLGTAGVPVFQGFTGGVGILLGNTGGYIIGFLAGALAMGAVQRLLGSKLWAMAVSMLLEMLVCYTFGTVWYILVYTQTTGAIALTTVLSWCVWPFVIPDLMKMALAILVSRRLSKVVGK